MKLMEKNRENVSMCRHRQELLNGILVAEEIRQQLANGISKNKNHPQNKINFQSCRDTPQDVIKYMPATRLTEDYSLDHRNYEKKTQYFKNTNHSIKKDYAAEQSSHKKKHQCLAKNLKKQTLPSLATES